jgi:FkbM family methyltransferase
MIATLARLARGLENYGNPLGLLAQRLLGTPTVQVVDRRTSIRCRCARGADRMFGEVFHLHEYDIPRMPLGPGDVVIDIGANHGFFTCYAARLGATVYAFEPTPAAYAALGRNVARNGLADRVVARPWAIGPEDGPVELICAAGLGGGQNTTSPAFAEAAGLRVTHRETVPCRTLAAVLGEFRIDRVRLCKLDCEGAELPILRSLGAAEAARIDAVVAEYHREAYDVADLLATLLGWGTHHVSFAESRHVDNAILRAVSARVLEEIALAVASGRDAVASGQE